MYAVYMYSRYSSIAIETHRIKLSIRPATWCNTTSICIPQ